MSPRDRILARRAKFLAAALAASGTVACAQVEEEPKTKDGGADTAAPDAPEPCLSAPIDSGGVDTAPVPCLDVAPDAGTDTFDAEPAPCLKVAPDSGTD